MREHPLAFTVWVAATLVATCALHAQGPKSPGKARPFLGPSPPEEIQVLAPLVGDWTTETTARPSSESKEGYSARGELTGQWLHNGHFLVQEGFSESRMARIEFTYITTYDRDQKAYRRWAFGSTGLTVEAKGKWDETTKTMTWVNVNPPKGETRVVKDALDKDRFVQMQVFKREDGTLIRDLTITASRKKEGTLASQGKIATKDDRSELDGMWELIYFERDGKEMKLQKATRAIITGGKFIIKRGDEVIAAGMFELDPSKKPKTSDTTYTDGPDKGKTFKGIYQVDGEMIKFCRAGSPDQERPIEFKTKPDNGGFVSVYKRVRE